VPIEDIRTVLLDYQSRTSVLLAEILFKKFWKRTPVFEAAGPDFYNRIRGNTAAVVIGDMALQLRSGTPHVYDLGDAWKQMTGLPFVFAAWISNKVLDPGWVERFDRANAFGLKNIKKVVSEDESEIGFDLNEYFTQHLSYDFDEKKQMGMDLFLKFLTEKQ